MKLILLIPLIDYNKKEIIPEVQRIGTYEIFFEKYENYCSLFEPKHPITRPRKEVVEKLEVEILWPEVLEIIAKKISESLEEKIIKYIKNAQNSFKSNWKNRTAFLSYSGNG